MAVIAMSGCRHIEPSTNLFNELPFIFDIYRDIVFVGDATGVDAWIRDFCKKREIRCVVYAANNKFSDDILPVVHTSNWDVDGRAAGPIRNNIMLKGADRLVAFWNGKSKGTLDAIKQATKLGLPVFIVPLSGEEYE